MHAGATLSPPNGYAERGAYVAEGSIQCGDISASVGHMLAFAPAHEAPAGSFVIQHCQTRPSKRRMAAKRASFRAVSSRIRWRRKAGPALPLQARHSRSGVPEGETEMAVAGFRSHAWSIRRHETLPYCGDAPRSLASLALVGLCSRRDPRSARWEFSIVSACRFVWERMLRNGQAGRRYAPRHCGSLRQPRARRGARLLGQGR